MKIYIYVLKHPYTGEIKYVGKTNDTKQRLLNHIHKARKIGKKPHLYCWIKGLLDEKLLPELEIIEVCDELEWEDREKYWINIYYKLGCDLCNMTDGGETSLGGVANVDIVKKIESIRKAIELLKSGKSQTESEKCSGLYKGFLGRLRNGKLPYLKDKLIHVPLPTFIKSSEHLKKHQFKKGRANPNKGKKLRG